MAQSHAIDTAGPPTGTSRLESVALGPFELDDGTSLPGLAVSYRHDGPGPDQARQILVVHALTGSADAAGDWWEPLKDRAPVVEDAWVTSPA